MFGIFVFLAFAAIWFIRPFKLRGTEGRPPFKWFVFAVLAGAFFSNLVAVILQATIGGLVLASGILSEVAYNFFKAFVMAALFEETLKFIPAYFFTKKSGAIQKIDYMLLFGAAGFGFELIESVLHIITTSSPIAVIFRVACLHVFWTMFLGAFFYEYKMAKQRGESSKATLMLVIGFLGSILLHGSHDIGLFLMTEVPAFEEIGFYIFVADIIAEIIVMVYVLRLANKEARLANPNK